MRNLLLILSLLSFTSIASAAIDPELMQKAQQGDADAQYNLDVKYDVGSGVPEDDKEAVKWYRLAAEQHNLPADR